jgi:hypothetical protein
VPRTFYRIVATGTPSRVDFASNKARGRAPRGAEKEDASLWEGISVYDDRLAAERTARRFPVLGGFIAELRIPDDAPVTYRQTFQPTHYTLWAEPDLLVGLIVAVSTVQV